MKNIQLDSLIGQSQFLDGVTPYYNMFRAGLAPENRPAGIFYLLGPTGVGKTYAVQCLANELQGSEKNLLMVNCGEYQLDHEIAKLIGAPPGYLGHRETVPVFSSQRLLTTVTNPHNPSIVLFDEIEKAAASLERILLGVLDNGTLRLGDGSLVDFRNSFIFLSSNVGANTIMESLDKRLGFDSSVQNRSKEGTEKAVIKELRKRFSPEFLNRVDEVIQFSSLNVDEVHHIVRLQLNTLVKRVEQRGFNSTGPNTTLTYDDGVVEYLANKSYDPLYGAREIKRVVFREIQAEAANLLVSHANVRELGFSTVNGDLSIRVVKRGGNEPEKELVTMPKAKTFAALPGNQPVGPKEDPAVTQLKKRRSVKKDV